MKKREITKWLFRAYLVYSVIADMVVLGGIVYLLLKLGGQPPSYPEPFFEKTTRERGQGGRRFLNENDYHLRVTVLHHQHTTTLPDQHSATRRLSAKLRFFETLPSAEVRK